MEQLTVRPATLIDLKTLLEFEQAMIVAERPFDEMIRTGEGVRYYDLAGLIAAPNVEIVVAEHAYLGFMYVVPEHRGKGVNKTVMKALEQWSISKGVMEMRLEVYTNNAAAIKAYEKVGFIPHMLEMRLDLDSI